MVNIIAIITTYFLEMLIAYSFFSQISEKKHSSIICIFLGTAVFEIGALVDIFFNNTIWLNITVFCLISVLFGYLCFKIKFIKIVLYSVMMDVFMTALEFVAIFLISILTKTEVYEYLNDISFFIIEGAIGKILYFVTCLIISRLVVREKGNTRIPIIMFLYPIIVVFVLILFWTICADYDLNRNHQLFLSFVSVLLFVSTIVLFIVYQHNIEKENNYNQIQREIEKAETDKKYYDILEKQNVELMIYAHDTKNHLNAIKELNNNEQIDEYINQMSNDLKNYSSTCHSGNRALDIIINKYATECEIKNIKFEFDIKLSNLIVLKDYDLISILGNVLDNAVEAANQSERRYVIFKTNKVNTYDSIVVINSCDYTPNSIDVELISSKNDKKSHGFGMKSIKKTIKKYKGSLDWEYDQQLKEFTTTIIIK